MTKKELLKDRAKWIVFLDRWVDLVVDEVCGGDETKQSPPKSPSSCTTPTPSFAVSLKEESPRPMVLKDYNLQKWERLRRQRVGVLEH